MSMYTDALKDLLTQLENSGKDSFTLADIKRAMGKLSIDRPKFLSEIRASIEEQKLVGVEELLKDYDTKHEFIKTGIERIGGYPIIEEAN